MIKFIGTLIGLLSLVFAVAGTIMASQATHYGPLEVMVMSLGLFLLARFIVAIGESLESASKPPAMPRSN